MKELQTSEGEKIIIRRAEVTDATAIIAFCKELFAATDQVITTLAEFDPTVQQEEDFIKSHSNSATAILLVAVCRTKVAGLLNFNCHARHKMKHGGEFGLSVLPEFQKNGIGRAMIEELLAWAHTKEQVEKIYLEVMHTNAHAIRLYESIGFIAEGRKYKAVKQPDGSYADLICMGYFINR